MTVGIISGVAVPALFEDEQAVKNRLKTTNRTSILVFMICTSA
jgi:hypothetical protein